MHSAVDDCVSACSWKMLRLIRTRKFHTNAELIGLFKAHILSYIEYRTAAVYHASSVLSPLDA
eukprot:7175571-Pyramimonas_sp.AAC.1